MKSGRSHTDIRTGHRHHGRSRPHCGAGTSGHAGHQLRLPVKRVAGKGAGAGMLQNIPLMLEITRAVVDTVKIPVTVKTRLGWDANSKIIVDLAEQLQDCGIAALTIHGRTRAQMYTGEADWTLIGEVKKNPRMHIPIIGNGDITTSNGPKNASTSTVWTPS